MSSLFGQSCCVCVQCLLCALPVECVCVRIGVKGKEKSEEEEDLVIKGANLSQSASLSTG